MTRGRRTLQESTFKVVLIDMQAPRGDGSSVFRLVRAGEPHARTILITGHRLGMDQLIAAMVAEGADAVCYKPFDVPELLDDAGAIWPTIRQRHGDVPAVSMGLDRRSISW